VEKGHRISVGRRHAPAARRHRRSHASSLQVVAATTWDVHRNIRANERPVTPQQQRELETWLSQWQKER
jgi:hypothetical protein